jgi:hypothetical protein
MSMHLHEGRCNCIYLSRLMQVHGNARFLFKESEMSRKPSAETTSAWARLVRVQQGLLAAVEQDLKKAGFPPLAWYDARRASPGRIGEADAAAAVRDITTD